MMLHFSSIIFKYAHSTCQLSPARAHGESEDVCVRVHVVIVGRLMLVNLRARVL